jgi:hypothetical protein
VIYLLFAKTIPMLKSGMNGMNPTIYLMDLGPVPLTKQTINIFATNAEGSFAHPKNIRKE